MDFLTDKVSVYCCEKCGNVADAKHWSFDEYEGLYCEHCAQAVKHHEQRDAGWWSVGVYEIYRAYGGPEEGGWWYDEGTLCDRWRVRGFDDINEARAYRNEIAQEYENAKHLRVMGFTETLPVGHFPKSRPHYS